jgi:hypothetical protein
MPELIENEQESQAAVQLLLLDHEICRKVGHALIKLLGGGTQQADRLDQALRDDNSILPEDVIFHSLEVVMVNRLLSGEARQLEMQIKEIAKQAVKDALHKVSTTL